jgi:hypothetical protein
MWGTAPMTIQRNRAFNYFERIFPFKTITRERPKSLVAIDPGERKLVFLAFPKHEASYTAELYVDIEHSNIERGCHGQRIRDKDLAIISNKVDLKRVNMARR